MTTIQCNLAQYTDTEITLFNKNDKTITVLQIIDGKLIKNRCRSGKDLLQIEIDK